MDSAAVRDGALLVLRLVLGVVFVAHGYQKAFIDGFGATAETFAASGVPQPGLSAYLAAGAELLGGPLLIVGLLTTIVAGVLILVMAGAIYFVHLSHGLLASAGGFEYPLVLVAALIIVVVFGAGRASLDGVLVRG